MTSASAARRPIHRWSSWLLPPVIVVVCWLCLAACATAVDSKEKTAKAGPDPDLRTFEGAWFSVEYPETFTPEPSLPSSTGEGVDSARFVSPEGDAAFYVFSPQWGGEPADIALDPEGEVLSAEKRTETADGHVRWFTICAKDGSYCRSYRDTVSGEGSVRTVVGIRYRDEAALKRWSAAYETFKRSLRQFGD